MHRVHCTSKSGNDGGSFINDDSQFGHRMVPMTSDSPSDPLSYALAMIVS